MTIYQAIISGVVQGITEFFPISSSGHLVILHNLFGLKDPQLAFDIFLHIGTISAVLIFFYRDILRLFGPDRKTLYFLLLASVPTFIIAFLFKDALENLFGLPQFAGYMLVVTGFFLIAAHIYSVISKKRNGIGPANSIIVGIAQGVSIIPGISRSGATIAAGMLCGVDGALACRFSFLLSIPAIAGASLFKAREINQAVAGSDSIVYIAGGIAAMITGLWAIKALLWFIKGNKLYAFGIYCIIAGISAIILIR